MSNDFRLQFVSLILSYVYVYKWSKDFKVDDIGFASNIHFFKDKSSIASQRTFVNQVHCCVNNLTL